MAEQAEAGQIENPACLVDCLQDQTKVAEFFTELTGRAVGTGDYSRPVSWQVDNKYYSAEVHFVACHPESKQLGEGQWEAIVLLTRLDKLGLETVRTTWERVGGHLNPAVCILLGLVAPPSGPSCRQEALEWCVGEGFELVEWGTEEGEGDCDEDDIIPERVGVARVAEALQVHVWPSMVMKKQGQPSRKQEDKEKRPENHECSPDVKEEVAGADRETVAGGDRESVSTSAVEKQNSDEQPTKPSTEETSKGDSTTASTSKDLSAQERIDSLLAEDCEEDLLASGLSDDQDPGGESFEKLFAKFAQMKEHAQSLSHEERKGYAEKVVMAFWKAIGGDEEEVQVDSD